MVVPLQMGTRGQWAATPVWWNRHHDKKLLAFAYVTGVPLMQQNKLVRDATAAFLAKSQGHLGQRVCITALIRRPACPSWQVCRCLTAVQK